MENKLSELGKPTALRNKHTGRTFNETENTEPQIYESLYSQEYVSALLAELEAKDERIGELEVIATEYAGKFQKAQDANKHLIIMSNDDKKRIAELESGHQEAAKQIASWRRIAKQNIEEREKDLAALDAERQKIIGLEAKLATPVRLLGEMLSHEWEHSIERQATFQHRKIAWDARLAEDKKAILAAGFTFTVEGDE
ncbi:TPA: hypothetical protein ACHQNL_002704 [Serratia marcescens]